MTTRAHRGGYVRETRSRLAAPFVRGDRPFVVVLLVVVALGLVTMAGPLQRRLEARDRRDLLAEQVSALEGANAGLAMRARDLQDPEQLELLAREELGFVRPGEVPFVVVEPPDDPLAVEAPPEPVPPPQPWYRRLWRALTGVFD